MDIGVDGLLYDDVDREAVARRRAASRIVGHAPNAVVASGTVPDAPPGDANEVAAGVEPSPHAGNRTGGSHPGSAPWSCCGRTQAERCSGGQISVTSASRAAGHGSISAGWAGCRTPFSSMTANGIKNGREHRQVPYPAPSAVLCSM